MRKHIAEWQRGGKELEKNRKARNQALIHLGLAVTELVKEKKVSMKSLKDRTVESKRSLVENFLELEMGKHYRKLSLEEAESNKTKEPPSIKDLI